MVACQKSKTPPSPIAQAFRRGCGKRGSSRKRYASRARAHPRVRPRAFSFTFAGVLDAAPGCSHAPPGETVSCVASRISHSWRVRCHSLSLSFLPPSTPPRSPVALACAVFFLLRRSNISGSRGRPTWAWQLSPRETGYTHNYVPTLRREEKRHTPGRGTHFARALGWHFRKTAADTWLSFSDNRVFFFNWFVGEYRFSNS